MKLHIFNPEHDIALATNVRRFTAPHAARQLRSDLGFLPALWADDGDIVLVDDVESALRRSRHLKQFMAEVLFVTTDDLLRMRRQNRGFQESYDVCPWGWDWGLVETLVKARIPRFSQISTMKRFLSGIRRVSSRRWAAEKLLVPLRESLPFETVGEAKYIDDASDLTFSEGRPVVWKAPWSSSGRGIRYIHDRQQFERNLSWARRVIAQQKGIMVEPYYQKVCDFAMEFETTSEWVGDTCIYDVAYKGLSLFTTKNGAYTGNIIATERAKREILSKYIPENVLEILKNKIVELMKPVAEDIYHGPFGVDMMIVSEGGKLAVHPCVELNLRRTMGHVALSIPCDDTMPQRTMRISLTDRYRLHIERTDENVLNNNVL